MPRTPELVPALVTLRRQVNEAHPLRSKASDGWIGDPAHRARFSYHNPDFNNWVHAIDITHDPKNGVDIGRFSDELVIRPDFRILEIIANRWYWHFRNPRWVRYTGSNPHTKHIHITVKPGLATAIDSRLWTGIPTLTIRK